ncbi:MAG: serine/threonine-protein kinase [Acidobacteria bacterium]|nr:serine/threonine-protein kinase [Acidobacteriota bacterium]
MSPERWRQIDTIFKSAIELPSEERAAFVERACGEDGELRAEVLSLVAHDQRGETLGAPAVEEAARLLAAESARAQSLAGRAVGAYRIVSRLGAGGMGEVYLAVHERTGRKVALKLLPDHFAGDEARVRRFQQEARAVLRLNHPNIVTVYDIEQEGGSSVIASEYIEGETLRARLARGPLAPAEALDVAAQVAAALSAAHAEGVVHRDVKPENVMLRPDGFVKVLDFGLAKLNEEAGTNLSQAPTVAALRTDPGVVMGTVAYMSPEQARGREVDGRTDIWSLGVLLYEALTARAPFRGESPTDVLAAIVGTEPAPLARYLAAAPDALEWIVTKALTKDRDGRYQTAKELLTDLKRLKQQLEFEAAASRSGEGLTTEGAASPSDGSPPARTTDAAAGAAQTGPPAARQTSSAEVILGELKRHKRGALVAALVVACALAAGGFGLYRVMRGAAPRRTPFEKFSVRQLGDTGQAADAALSPDGEFVAYVKEEAGRQSLWLRQTNAVSSVQIVPAAEGQRIVAPLFSRDGAFVYYLKAPQHVHLGTLYRVPKLGGGETKLTEAISVQDTRHNFALSPDGRQVAFIRLDEKLNRSVVVANLGGGGERVLYRRDLPEFLSGASWSRDGQTIAFVQGTFQGAKTLMAVNVADGSVGRVTGHSWKTVGGFEWTADSGALVVAAAERGDVLQLWRLPFPEGEPQRITNDVSTYANVSLSSDSSVLATVQFNVVQNIWTAAAGASAGAAAPPAQFTFGAGRYDGARGLAWTRDGRIVYHSLAGGSDDIWIMNADGTGQRQLTGGAGTNMYPVVSPDGRYVLYSSTEQGENSGLWRMNLDGSDAKLLLRDGGLSSVSPDSRWVLCYKGGNPVTVWRVPLEGGEPERVRLPEAAQATAPFISPDGRLVAYNYRTAEPGAQWQIAVFPFEGGDAPSKVFDVAGAPVRQLRWAPDGRAVCHIDTRQAVSNIMCLPLDGGPPFPVTDFKADRIDAFDWSPDGRRLAISRGSDSSGVVLISDSK